MGEGGGAPLHAISAALQDALHDKGVIIQHSHNSPMALYEFINEKKQEPVGVEVKTWPDKQRRISQSSNTIVCLVNDNIGSSVNRWAEDKDDTGMHRIWFHDDVTDHQWCRSSV